MADGMERFDPMQSRGRLAYEHLHRYAICLDHVKGMRVLDLACGAGYGSSILASSAIEVVGIDINADTINAAKDAHQKENLKFEIGDCLSLPFDEGSFDVVVANEVIEHVTDHAALLAQAKRVLKEEGVLLVSTPNKPVYNRYIAQNEFHLSEVTIEEFSDELNRAFENVQLVGTRMALVSIGHEIGEIGRKGRKPSVYVGRYSGDGQPNIGETDFRLADPEYVLAYCTDREIENNIFKASIYVCPDDDLWLEHEKVIAWASRLHIDYQELHQALIKKNDEYWACKQQIIDLENSLFKYKGLVHELRSAIEGRVL